MPAFELIRDLVLLLAASLLLGAAFARLRQSVLVGYLLAGTLLGPHGLNVIRQEQSVEAIAELGVALLLFSLGLEFSWPRLRAFGRRALLAGVLQIGLTIAATMLVATACGLRAPAAFVAGAMVALSSTACVLRVLADRAEIESAQGRAALGILLLQDLAVVPLALAVNVLGRAGGAVDVAGYAGQIVVWALGLVAVLHLLLHRIAVWGLGTLTLARNRDLTVLLAVVAGLGSAFAAHQARLSPALGAFVAGMLLGGSPFAAQVRADVSSLRVVLLTLFFSATGMLGDPAWMLRNLGPLLLVTAAVIAGKAALAWLCLRLVRTPHRVGLSTGLCLAQMSEFTFVLGGLARAAGVLDAEPAMLISSSAIVTLLATPFLIAWAPRLAAALGRRRGAVAGSRHGPPMLGPDVVIVGFGPAGQRVGQTLMGTRRAVLVIDLSRDAERGARAMGLDFLPGDATQHEVLVQARVERAEVVVLALPTPTVAREVLRLLRELAPQAKVIVRVRYHAYAAELAQAGAHAVVDEELEVGRRLAMQVRVHLAPASEPVAAADQAVPGAR